MPLNRECPKCAYGEARVRYNRVMDHMELQCGVCGYEWLMKPVDVMRADKEHQRALSESTGSDNG